MEATGRDLSGAKESRNAQITTSVNVFAAAGLLSEFMSFI